MAVKELESILINHNGQNASKPGEENCTVWYDRKGTIYSVGPGNPDVSLKLVSVQLKFDSEHFCPRAAVFDWNSGNARDLALGKVLKQIKKYRITKGYDQKATV